MKRPQIGVRRRISELLCVKSTSFFFSFFFFFLFRSGIIYSGMAKTGPVRPVLKPVRNTTIFVLVYALVRNMPAIPAGTV